MLTDMKGRTHKNADTELPDTWKPLAAVTTRYLNKALGTPFADAGGAAEASGRSGDCEKTPAGGGSDGREKQTDEQRETFVRQRVKELEEFERRASGIAPIKGTGR